MGKEKLEQNEEKLGKKDSLGRSYGTGRRKNSSARVWIKAGSGKFTVNGIDIDKYFVRPVSKMIIVQPFDCTNTIGMYDVTCTVKGGGLSGQAGAIRHGISRALNLYDPSTRPFLKKAGYITRDPRAVERKKYGKAKARKSFQFSKR